ncbi:extracellular serine rich protein [Aspergillus lucknowensis]|uniref:Extracellular membrane protein CFEM domain-containing protein n=1 Tax=Aspergillus lucknowensis TaxID=176173 RepID=A0ABR4LJS0_9EURO
MHLSAATLLTLLPITLTLAYKQTDLSYLKCVTAVVKTTHFPECTSSYKLDCFCEAASQPQALTNTSGTAGVPHSRTGGFRLPPETEDICASFGVPKNEIPKYLCDDDAVPVSPRRGSTPMVRLEQPVRNEVEENETETETETEAEIDELDGEQSTEVVKRAMQPDTPRLLIPENEPAPNTGAANYDGANESVTKDQEREPNRGLIQDQNEDDEDEEAHAVYEVVTVTKTETRCPCIETASRASTEPEVGSEGKTSGSGALHETEGAVATSAAVPGFNSESKPTDVPSPVRVASSSVTTSVAPTGVDAEKEHAGNEDSDDEEGEAFQGGAVSMDGSRSVIGVLMGVLAGAILL